MSKDFIQCDVAGEDGGKLVLRREDKNIQVIVGSEMVLVDPNEFMVAANTIAKEAP